jgi:hypothetical protein
MTRSIHCLAPANASPGTSFKCIAYRGNNVEMGTVVVTVPNESGEFIWSFTPLY